MNQNLKNYMPAASEAVEADLPEHERYLFDLQGFLLVRDAVDPETLEAAAAVAERIRERIGMTAEGICDGATGPLRRSWRLDHPVGEHPEFLAMVMSPKVLARVLNFVVYPKLKSTWLDLKALGGKIGYHSNHTPYLPVDAYHCHQGRIHCNLLTVCYALADIPAEGGALEVIPGSHKANFPLPESELLAEARVKLPMRKGDALLFTHDLNHGSHNQLARVRRALFSSFSPGISAHTLGMDDLYDPLFEASGEASWQRYLLRRPKGDRDTWPQPAHTVFAEAELGRLPRCPAR